MQNVSMMVLSLCVAFGLACASPWDDGLSPGEVALTPEQKQTRENLQFIQRKLYVDYQRKLLSETVWGLRSEAQIQSLENFQWLQDHIQGQEFLLRAYR